MTPMPCCPQPRYKPMSKFIKLMTLPALIACMLMKPALASHDHPSPWKGTNANFGLTINSGDTDTKNINTGLVLQYAGINWNNALNLTYQMAYSDGTQNKSIFNGTENLSYYLSADKKTFVAGNLNVVSDMSSSYRYTLVSSLMYGRTLVATHAINWDMQAGPGWRYNAAYSTGTSYKRPVGVVLTNLDWKLSSWGTLSEKGRAEFGTPYNFYQSITALTNTLSGHLALQLSFQVDHYSKLPKTSTSTSLTNTTTMASLVYNF